MVALYTGGGRLCTSPLEILAMLFLLNFLLVPDLELALMLPQLVVLLRPIVASLAYVDVSLLHHAVRAKRSATGLLVPVPAIA